MPDKRIHDAVAAAAHHAAKQLEWMRPLAASSEAPSTPPEDEIARLRAEKAQGASPDGDRAGQQSPSPAVSAAPAVTITSRGPAAADLRVSVGDVDRLLSWGEDYGAGLRRHVSWLKTIDGIALPGAALVISEMEKDMGLNLALMIRLHEHRAALQTDAPAPCDEPPKGGDPVGAPGQSPASAVGEAEAPSIIPPTLHTHPNPKREDR